MGNFLIGAKRPAEILLGSQSAAQIYLGTELVWEKETGIWTYYDHGFINDIAWTRNAYGEASSGNSSNDTHLLLYYTGSARGSWRTSMPVKVPRNAHTLQVVFGKANYSPRANFGLIHKDVTGGTGQVNTENGGQVYNSGWVTISGTTTLDMTLNDNLKGSEDYYIVCSALFSGSNRMDLRIYSVRFLDENGAYLN